MSLGAKTVAPERRSEERRGEERRGEEKRNFNDLETSLAGLEGWNATDTSLVLLL